MKIGEIYLIYPIQISDNIIYLIKFYHKVKNISQIIVIFALRFKAFIEVISAFIVRKFYIEKILTKLFTLIYEKIRYCLRPRRL